MPSHFTNAERFKFLAENTENVIQCELFKNGHWAEVEVRNAQEPRGLPMVA